MSAREDEKLDEIELLLPWRATGALSAEETRRVDAALATDAELRRKYELVQEEMAESVAAAEELGAPSLRMRDRLFAAIEAEAGPQAAQARPRGWRARALDFFGSLTPQAVAWSAAAAALVIVVQGAVLTRSMIEPGGIFRTASLPESREGSFALVAFAPQATAQRIAEFLQARGATIVDGPKPGGLFRVKVSAKRLDPDALKAAVAALAAHSDVVRMAVASE